MSLPAVTRASIAAATVLLITCAVKLTFMASCAKDFRCLSVTLCNRWYSTFCSSISYSFNMSAHLAVPVSGCPCTTTPSPTLITSCLRKSLHVHLRRWGGSNTAAISWQQNLKKGVFTETPNCFKALTLLAPMSHTVTCQLPVLHCGRHQEPPSRNYKHYCFHESNSKLLVASTSYVDHTARRPGYNLRYCLSCWVFQGPQSLQYCQSSNLKANTVWVASHQTWDMWSLSDTACTLSLSTLNTCALMPVLNWTVFRRDCKVLLEGRGNRDWRNASDQRLCFRPETAQTFSL